MAFFGPGTATALAAGAQGGDLVEQMRQRALQNQVAQNQADQIKKQQQARAMLGQVLQGLTGQVPNVPPPAMPRMPSQQGGAMPPAQGVPPPGAQPQQPPQGAPAQNAAAGPPDIQPQNGGPIPLQAQAAAASQAANAAAPQAQPGQSDAFSWGQVLDAVRAKTGADPETVYLAVQDIMGNIDKEADRKSKMALTQAQLDQKNQALMQTLQWRYYNTDKAEERAKILGDIKILQTQMQGQTQRDVAGINANSRENVANIGASSAANVANIGAASRAQVAGINATSHEKIASAANALKSELGNAALDVKADQIAKTYWVKNRELELKQQGMDQNQAQFQAKLEATLAMAANRDDTTRRGQDLVHQDRVSAETGRNTRLQTTLDAKTQVLQQKALPVVEEALSKSDELMADAVGLLNDPNLDKSVGARVSHVPGFFSQDIQNFRDKLDSFKAEKMMALISQLKSFGNGSTGFGRITNFEAQSLQNSIASLRDTQDPQQFRESLLKLINQVSASRARLAKGYEAEFSPKATGAGGGGVKTPSPQAAKIPTPEQVKSEPDGTVFKMDGKTYTKQGDQSVVTE